MDVRSPIIIDELQGLQSGLATWPVAMPFRVPPAYFAAFPESLALILAADEVADPIPAFGKLNLPLAAPSNYFAQFTADLAEAIEAETITETFTRENTFAVPEGYFDGLAASVMTAIAQEEEAAESELTGLPKTNVFAVPEGYFDGLANEVMAVVETEEITETFSRDPVFAVPEGYFDRFAAQLQARIAAEEAPKVIPLRPRRLIPIQVMRWAAAAALVVGIFTGIRNADAPKTATATTQRALAAIPEGTLQDYVFQHADDFDAEMIEVRLPASTFEKTTPATQLDTREIQSFLSEEAML